MIRILTWLPPASVFDRRDRIRLIGTCDRTVHSGHNNEMVRRVVAGTLELVRLNPLVYC